jgi:ABC-type nitrate/sulfonate/bicarbonate transport system substrate-binding protein
MKLIPIKFTFAKQLAALLFYSFLTLTAISCAAKPQSPGTATSETDPLPMTFMAGYKPQANLPFVGVYVAQEKGYFSEEGLQVTIKHSPGKGEHLQLVTLGEVQITTQDAAVLLKRRSDPGLPLVSIALIGQRGQQAFAALESSGLKTPKDWEGHTVGFKGTPPPDLYALLDAAGADPSLIDLINVGFDPRVLTEGQVDIYPLYKSNEPFLIQEWGYELTLWDAADYGVPTLGLTYVTSEETLQNEQEMLTHFLRAALRGIAHAEQNQDEAIEIVLQYTGPETDPEHMRFMLETELLDLHNDETELHGIGWQTREQWQALTDMLVASDAMNPVDVDTVFTTEILELAASVSP